MKKLKIDYEYLKYLMKSEGITYDDLAKKLNCSTQDLYYLLNKDTIPIYYSRLFAICQILKVSLEDVTQVVE